MHKRTTEVRPLLIYINSSSSRITAQIIRASQSIEQIWSVRWTAGSSKFGRIVTQACYVDTIIRATTSAWTPCRVASLHQPRAQTKTQYYPSSIARILAVRIRRTCTTCRGRPEASIRCSSSPSVYTRTWLCMAMTSSSQCLHTGQTCMKTTFSTTPLPTWWTTRARRCSKSWWAAAETSAKSPPLKTLGRRITLGARTLTAMTKITFLASNQVEFSWLRVSHITSKKAGATRSTAFILHRKSTCNPPRKRMTHRSSLTCRFKCH